MIYKNIKKGIFKERPNRFIAKIEIDGKIETVHVKNTGRCKELLIDGCEVILSKSDNQSRKTKYDLIAVYKKGLGLVNIDSQAPNYVVKEWLEKQGYDIVKPEYFYGNSRLDFYCQKGDEKTLIEVKGCTLEKDGIGYFPDAPTLRGTKHLKELKKAVEEGYKACIIFAIQMENVFEVRANKETDPAFANALLEACQAGVEIICLTCEIRENEIKIG
ncbi:MAG: DNA/RNA nuclease SfsA [Ruminococcaceae bacterium]|nr:DNA/RNA nuclease SfsA [Oscillospiraceae bacterium]